MRGYRKYNYQHIELDSQPEYQEKQSASTMHGNSHYKLQQNSSLLSLLQVKSPSLSANSTNRPQNLGNQIRQIVFRGVETRKLNQQKLKDLFFKLDNYFDQQNPKANSGVFLVSGQHGVGKKTSIIAQLHQRRINFIKLKAEQSKFCEIMQQIIGKAVLRTSDCKKLSIYSFKKLIQAKNRKKVVILIQNAEYIFLRGDDPKISQLLSVFSDKSSKMAIVGVTNNMKTLPKLLSVKQSRTIKFQHYRFQIPSIEDIKQLLSEKIQSIKKECGYAFVYRPAILSFLSSKLFDETKGNLTLLFKFFCILLYTVIETTNKGSDKGFDLPEDVIKVQQLILTPVLLKQLMQTQGFASQIDSLVQVNKLQFPVQIALISIYTLMESTGQLTFQIAALENQTKWVCKSLGMQQYQSDRFESIIDDLKLYSLIANRPGKQFHVRISMNKIKESFENVQIYAKFFRTDQ